VVRRLPPSDKARLRAHALALARLQRRVGLALPVNIVRQLLGLTFSDEAWFCEEGGHSLAARWTACERQWAGLDGEHESAFLRLRQTTVSMP
jgi:hypothetical protein